MTVAGQGGAGQGWPGRGWYRYALREIWGGGDVRVVVEVNAAAQHKHPFRICPAKPSGHVWAVLEKPGSYPEIMRDVQRPREEGGGCVNECMYV